MPTSGAVRVGETVVVGHYEQQGLDLPVDMTILDFVIDSGALGDGGKCVYMHKHAHTHTHIYMYLQQYVTSGGATLRPEGQAMNILEFAATNTLRGCC